MTVRRVLSARRHTRLRFSDLERMGVRLRVARHFITTFDWRPMFELHRLERQAFASSAQQMTLAF
jgi:predicted DNA-binding helix-hairpin-helix protein